MIVFHGAIIMKILGLDISSSTIGWALIDVVDDKVSLIKYGHLKPPSKKKSNNNFALRLDFAFEEIKVLVSSTSPDVIAIEDYAKKFSSGRSSANTILVLASFNEVCGLAAYKTVNKQPVRIPVTTLRKLVKNEYSESVKDKDEVLAFCKKHFKSFVTTLNRAGNIKTECYDEADAIIVALGYYLNNK
jgi:Holliday junction resolvasome RuvABC endonuclease subunit